MDKEKIRLGIDARILSQPMNGVARHLILLLKGLALRKDFEALLFSDTPLREEYKEYFSGYRLILFNRPKLKKYWKNWILPCQLSKHKVDVYHAIWDKGVPLVSPCPVVMSIHDLYPISGENKAAKPFKKFRRHIDLFLEALKAKKILAISETTREEIVKKLRISRDKAAVAYLDCDRRHIKEAALPEEAKPLPYGLVEGKYFIGIIGRLDDVRKNTPFLIKSFSKFLKEPKNPGHKLVIAGGFNPSSEPYRALKNLVRERGIEKYVIFSGYLGDPVLYNLVKKADAVIFTSLFEGFGIPILEAFTLGTPVITSNRSSMAEIASGGSALLVDPASEEELASAMSSISTGAALRKRLVENGFRRLQDFDWNITMEKIISLYYDIVKDKMRTR